MRRLWLAGVLVSLALPALAETKGRAVFAVVVGVNQSADPELAPLRYADDDAAQYQDLFRLLGARTYLLADLDDNTKRLHPQAAAEARPPTRSELDAVLGQLAADVAQAHQRGVETVYYFVYAGHGNVRDGEGYLGLEDARLSGRQIAEDVVGRAHADQVHVIVDACYSSFLAYGRGPGGQRRPVHGFAAGQLATLPNVGFLLSTSSARESHEWEGFQAGVFSHEVRSGLYGAADADGDGQVSYREISAFVTQANAAIPNERFRPDILARPPRGSEVLIDLRDGFRRRVEVDGAQHAHYQLEDSRGVRLADFHNGATQQVRLLRPVVSGRLYLRRLTDDKEYVLGPGPDVIRVAELTPDEPRSRTRGAAHDSFSLAFALPFDDSAVAHAMLEPFPELVAERASTGRVPKWRRVAGWTAASVAAAATVGGLTMTVLAQGVRDGASAGASQAEAYDRNARIRQLDHDATRLFTVGGAAVVVGAVLLLWPDAPATGGVWVPTDGTGIGYAGTF